MRLRVLLLWVLLLSGCVMPFRRAKAPPPPGPIPVRIPDQVTSAEPAPPPQNLPAPPAIGTSATDTKPTSTKAVGLPPTLTAAPPEPERKEKPVKRAAMPPKSAVPVPAVTETSEEAAPAPPPFRLGELRTLEETQRLRRQTEQLIEQCTATLSAALAAAEGRSLTSMQSEMVNRVRTFAQQAREAIEADPGEAKNFASKGKTFADALLAELK
ncbi:MAG: hypothetical protein ACKV2U_04250 [Bryobacteraceae bacterium]